MKKLLTLLMSIMLVFAFAACGKDEDKSEPSSKSSDDNLCVECEENEGTEKLKVDDEKVYYCEDCFEELPECSECGEKCTGDNKNNDENVYCDDCYEELKDIEMCEECGDKEATEDGLCDDCYEELNDIEMCEECGDKEATEDGLCDDCYEEFYNDVDVVADSSADSDIYIPEETEYEYRELTEIPEGETCLMCDSEDITMEEYDSDYDISFYYCQECYEKYCKY